MQGLGHASSITHRLPVCLPGACEREPVPPVPVHPVPCLPPGPKGTWAGTAARPPSRCQGQPQLHTSPEMRCAMGSVTRVLDPMSPRARAGVGWALPIAAQSRSFVCTGLMTPAQTPRCSHPGAPAPALVHPPALLPAKAQLWTETPATSQELLASLLSISGSRGVRLCCGIAGRGWRRGEG